MKRDDIIMPIYGKSLKYRIIKIEHTPVEYATAIRVKYDKRIKDWVSFGRERSLLLRGYRLFTQDDFHYI